jgi:hypothetical protein
MREHVLLVWGLTIRCRGFSAGELEELENEFSGSIGYAEAETVDHSLTRIHREVRSGVSAEASRIAPRHRGGSREDKFFLDGRVFDIREQRRDAVVLAEEEQLGAYLLDGVLCVATPSSTLLIGPELPRYVLADVVENLLLCDAKRRGWLQCHAAAWVEDRWAHLVVGSPGAGKTTQLMRALKQGALMLGNDRVFLRSTRGGLQVRGFPLAMNVGCGTIRALELDLPHNGRDDHQKIRLTAREISERFTVDYDGWWDVGTLRVPDRRALSENLYWDEDPSHPHWNAALRTRRTGAAHRDLANLVERTARLETLLAAGVEA